MVWWKRHIEQKSVERIGRGDFCRHCDGEAVCDLEYVEDSAAETDMNVVMMEDGRMIEVQGTAEGEPFSHEELLTLLDLAKQGCDIIFQTQRAALAD